MDKLEEIMLMFTIAELYYTQKLTQQEIASQTGLSRSKVSRYLKECEDNGIVKITITNPLQANSQLQETIRNKYKLKDIIIVPSSREYDSAVARKNVAKAAASYMSKIIRDGDTVGIQWGRTHHGIMQELDQTDFSDITLVQIQGNSYVSPFDSNEVAFGIAKKLNTSPYILPAPNVMTNAKAKENLMKEPRIIKIFEYINNADVIIYTVGTIKPDDMHMFHKEFFVSDSEVASLIEKGAVGDICGRCFDINGDICDKEQYNRIIGIDFDSLRNSKMPVLIASGEEKAKAIVGALNAGFCKVLITDDFTANLINSAISAAEAAV